MKTIKFDDVRYKFNVNLSSTVHAEAFLLAAGHYLSSWPQEWSAAYLADVLRDEVEGASEERTRVQVWEGVVTASRNEEVDEYEYAFEHIEGLTLDFIAFAIRYSSEISPLLRDLVEGFGLCRRRDDDA